MNTKILRDGDRVWLEGVESWFCGTKHSSVHAAQESVMKAVGEDVPYEYLLGVSGLAFRMQIFKLSLCPGSPHAFVGYQCVERASRALPWDYEFFDAKPEETERVKQERQAVKESIDRGVPVQYGIEEDGIVVGYAKDGEEWICYHTFHDKGNTTFIETRVPWGVMVFTKRKETLPVRRELVLESLRQALDMAHAPETNNCYLGFEAWEHYIKIVEGLDAAGEEAQRECIHANAWIYECLAGYRRDAGKYLRMVASDFPPVVASHLEKAAALYTRMSDEVLTADKGTLEIAPYGWSLKPGQTWSSEMRADQVRRLRESLSLEREALAEIEAALVSSDGS